jgi:hypothetical protein
MWARFQARAGVAICLHDLSVTSARSTLGSAMRLRTLLGTLAALALTALVCVGLAGPASATYGPESDSATVSATTVHAGGTVTVGGGDFFPGSMVTVTVRQGGDVYLTQKVRADANGNVSVTLALTESGTNTITLSGRQADGTGTRVMGTTVGVNAGNAADAAAGAAALGGNDLPRTGGVDFTPLYAGFGLLFAGALLVGVARSRRRILV